MNICKKHKEVSSPCEHTPQRAFKKIPRHKKMLKCLKASVKAKLQAHFAYLSTLGARGFFPCCLRWKLSGQAAIVTSGKKKRLAWAWAWRAGFFPARRKQQEKKNPLAPRVLFIKLRIINSHTMTYNKINVRITGPPPHEFRLFYNFAHQNRIFFKALTRCGHFGSTKRICEFV